LEFGSATAMAKAAATAASTALPPALRISAPAREARGWAEATIPPAAVTSAFLVAGQAAEVRITVRRTAATRLAARRLVRAF